jgi:hypothetical protein
LYGIFCPEIRSKSASESSICFRVLVAVWTMHCRVKSRSSAPYCSRSVVETNGPGLTGAVFSDA